jgi:hypothetical protein
MQGKRHSAEGYSFEGLYGDQQGIAGRTLQEIEGLEVPLLRTRCETIESE